MNLMISLLPKTPKTLGVQLVHTCSFLLTKLSQFDHLEEKSRIKQKHAFYSSGVRSATRAKPEQIECPVLKNLKHHNVEGSTE